VRREFLPRELASPLFDALAKVPRDILQTPAMYGGVALPDLEDCGTPVNSRDLKELIATARSLRFADFGNGFTGLYAECDDFHFCAIPEESAKNPDTRKR
jgi:hypothetical protein